MEWLKKSFPELSELSPLKNGGQKHVFGCAHQQEGDVVLKLFRSTADAQRVKREVEAMQKVQCLRVPRVLGVGTVSSDVGEIVWLLEQRIPGEDLRSRLDSNGPLSANDILRIALHVLEALTAAEKVKIVHRDIKPANIIGADDGSFWLIDFGFARHLDLESLTSTGALNGFGTIGYAPIEQCSNQRRAIDVRADLFALGVTLYECSAGANPFIDGARDQLEAMRRTGSVPLPPLDRTIDEANQFRELVQSMTRTYREQRISSAAEALAWIQEICEREQVF